MFMLHVGSYKPASLLTSSIQEVKYRKSDPVFHLESIMHCCVRLFLDGGVYGGVKEQQKS